MLLPALEYARASTISDAVALLAAPNARVLAGGQTLVERPQAADHRTRPARGRDPDRRAPRIERDDGGLVIGAAVTYQELVESPDVWDARPVLAETGGAIADQQVVRTAARIGGNVCLNLPTSHFPPVLSVVGARFTIAGPDGERTVAAPGFFETVFTVPCSPASC